MDSAIRDRLDTLRNRLLERQGALRGEVRAAQQTRLDGDPAVVHEVADQKEAAARWQSSGLQDAQERRDLDELRQVDAALDRIDTGTFGDCPDCGEPIPVARLMSQPSALRCADCQAAQERRQERLAQRGTA